MKTAITIASLSLNIALIAVSGVFASPAKPAATPEARACFCPIGPVVNPFKDVHLE